MSRHIVLYIASSIDGYIARSNGDVDWLLSDQDYDYQSFYSTVDTVLMGRKTYEQILGFGEFPYKEKACYVFSKKEHADNQHVTFIRPNGIKPLLMTLKKADGNDIWLVGGAAIIRYFMYNDLIDAYIIFIQPILLGEGIRLFLPFKKEQMLKLKKHKSYSSGMVELHYIRTSGYL